MALSGQYVLTRTALEIYQEVLELLQVIGDGETITQAMKDKITPSLNNMLKSWEDQGIHLWTYHEGTLFIEVGQPEYDFRLSTTKVANDFEETTLTDDAAASATTITVEDASNILSGDQIGIIETDDNLFWTTVNGAPAGDVVTLTDALPLGATSGSFVRSYTDAIIPVRRILNVRRQEATNYEIPIVFESREDYFNLPNKESQGNPIQAYYSRQEPQGIMYLWNTPASSVPLINFTYERETQIITDDTDNFDLPSYWIEALCYNIADRLTLKFSCSAERRAELKGRAMESLNNALSFDDAVYPIEVKVQQYG